MTKNKITEGNAFSLIINQAVWADIGAETTPIPANELEDVHLYIGRGPYKAQATEYQVMASGDKLIAYIDHTLKVGMYSTWITAYCNGRRVASNCKESFEIVSFDEHCSQTVDEVCVCPSIYLQGTTAADEAIRQMQEAERVAAEAERKITFDALKASFVAFLAESKEQWDAWIASVRQQWNTYFDNVKEAWSLWFSDTERAFLSWFENVKQVWTSWFDSVKTEWQVFFAESKAHDEAIRQAEKERATEEAKRQQQEQLRADAESNRVLAEEQRVSTFKSNEQERADTFSQNESERNIAFKTSEKNRADTFDANEIRRENTFNTNEQERESTFNTNESDRTDTFSTNEASRNNTFINSESERAATFEANEQRRDEDVAVAIAKTSEELYGLGLSVVDGQLCVTFNS